MEQWLSGVDRGTLIKLTAAYLVIYTFVNACVGVLYSFAGGLVASVGVMAGASGEVAGTDVTETVPALVGLGGLAVVVGILYLISVPLFAIAAFGLIRRTSWARIGAIVALGFSILLSALTLNTSVGGIIWILISGFAVYLFLTDAGIKQTLES